MKQKQATRDAMRYVANGMTVYAAAKAFGVAQSTVHRALARDRNACPACGQAVKESK
jgi:transposase